EGLRGGLRPAADGPRPERRRRRRPPPLPKGRHMEFLTSPPPPIRRLELEDPAAATQVLPPAPGESGTAAPSGFTAARRSISAPQFSIRRMEIDNLSVSYAQREAVKGVSLPVRQGEVLSLIGPSGCGKTTLLRSLNRLTELTRTARLSGRILLDDVD